MRFYVFVEVERENQMELNIFSVKFNQNNIKAYNQDSCPAFTGKNIKPAVKTVALGTTTALAYLGVNQTNKKENAFINKFFFISPILSVVQPFPDNTMNAIKKQ